MSCVSFSSEDGRVSFSSEDEIYDLRPYTSTADVVSAQIEDWLREAYTHPLAKAKARTHGGYASLGGNMESDGHGGTEATRQATLPRTQTTEPALELETWPFLERSSIYLRLKAPLSKWCRGYGNGSQPFKAHDIQCWRRIAHHDWTILIGNECDILLFINTWLKPPGSADFSWDVLDVMLAMSPDDALFDAYINGDARNMGNVVCDPCLGPSVEVRWACKVCKEDGKPTQNIVRVPKEGREEDGLFLHDFCVSCKTYRYDEDVWMCPGPPRRTHPQTICKRSMQMIDCPFGVPCCSGCGEVRYQFPENDIFEKFSNVIEEPVPDEADMGLVQKMRKD